MRNSVTMLTISPVINLTSVTSRKQYLTNIFDKHAPIKLKYLRANEAPFMTRESHKEIMKRSRVRNNFLKTKSQEDR